MTGDLLMSELQPDFFHKLPDGPPDPTEIYTLGFALWLHENYQELVDELNGTPTQNLLNPGL